MTVGRNLVAIGFALGGAFVGLGGCDAFEEPAGSGGDGGASADGGADVAPDVTDGAPAGPCNERPITAWSTPRRLSELRGSDGAIYFVDPFVTADGLTLWAGKLSGDRWVAYRATRASRDAAWGPMEPQEGISAPGYSRLYPSSASPGEVVVTVPGSSLDIAAATPDGGGWSVTRYEELVRPDVDLWPSISADGVLLLYGHVGATPGNPFKILWQVTRAAPARSSQWSTQRDEVFEKPDGGTTLPPGLEWPAMTPDGLGLFYALSEKPEVWFVDRARRADVFFAVDTVPTPIPALAAVSPFTTRVRSMTADGCELYLTSDRDGDEDAYVATRQ